MTIFLLKRSLLSVIDFDHSVDFCTESLDAIEDLVRGGIALHVGRGRHEIVIIVSAHTKHVLILMLSTEGLSCFDGTCIREIITCASKG